MILRYTGTFETYIKLTQGSATLWRFSNVHANSGHNDVDRALISLASLGDKFDCIRCF